MPIVVAPLNTELRIVKVLTDEKSKKHLQDLGISVNSAITILSNDSGGIICVVQNGRLALDKTLAMKIFVA